MEFVPSAFNHKKHAQFINIRCQNSNIWINSLTFSGRKITIEVVDYKRRIFVVKDQETISSMPRLNFYRLNDNGRATYLKQHDGGNLIFMPICGVGIIHSINTINIYDVETLRLKDDLFFEDKISLFNVVDEWIFVLTRNNIFTAINYETRERYNFKMLTGKMPEKLRDNFKFYTIKELINWTSYSEIAYFLMDKKSKKTKHIFPFSENYISTFKRSLLEHLIPDLVHVVVPYLGF